MKEYKIITYITMISTILFSSLSVLFHFQRFDWISAQSTEYWSNFCLSIFGSSLVTLLSSILMYHYERKRTLKNFLYFTIQILRYIGRFRYNMTDEEKLQFFKGYMDLDKLQWKNEYYNLSFFFDRLNHDGKKKYIHDKIVVPIEQFNTEVVRRIVVLRPEIVGDDVHLDDGTIQTIIHELQDYLIERKEEKIAVEYDEKGTPTRWTYHISEKAKFYADIDAELHGRYSVILHGKRQRDREV